MAKITTAMIALALPVARIVNSIRRAAGASELQGRLALAYLWFFNVVEVIEEEVA